MKTLSGKGRTALVTGARRGIGLGIAKALLEDGYRVMLCSVTRGEDAVKGIGGGGSTASSGKKKAQGRKKTRNIQLSGIYVPLWNGQQRQILCHTKN